MKIIHTSDWHLGRSFGPVSLASDQQAFCDWFVDLVTDEAADLVVIAGDLYDRAIAPVEAIEVFRRTIGRLLASGTTVAAITGNHDGADRVAPYGELLDLSRFYLRGGYDRVGGVITHIFDDGPLDIVLLPYLDPRAAPDTFGDRPEDPEPADDDPGTPNPDQLIQRRHARTHQSVLTTAAEAARAACGAPRSIAVAHAFVTGGSESESERQLVVGGTGAVDATVFDGFSYVALGHLHRPQDIGQDDRIRYSGTPLAYSFSETHAKSVTILDLDTNGGRTVRTEVVPIGHAVCTVSGTMAELVDPSAHPDAHDSWVRAIITDRETVLDAKARLAKVYPRITEIQLRPDGHDPTPNFATASVDRLAPLDAVHQFWQAAEGAPPPSPVDELLVGATTRAAEVVDQ